MPENMNMLLLLYNSEQNPDAENTVLKTHAERKKVQCV